MGRFSVILVSLFVLAGCGRGPTAAERAEFDPYFERFQSYSKEYGRDMSKDPQVDFLFQDLETDVVGACEQGPFHSPRVLIDPESWRTKSDAGREAIVFHELGHCVLGRDHRDGTMNMSNGGGLRVARIPVSLMHLRGVPGALYSERKDEYLKELFSVKQ